MRWTAVALVGLLLSGCVGDQGGQPQDDGGGSSTAPNGSGPLVEAEPAPPQLSGSVGQAGRGHAANVSAYNPSGTTYAVDQYCQWDGMGYGSWTASLSGPPGDDLDYRHPDRDRQHCSGMTGKPMPPETWFNWTYAGNARGCLMTDLCDNWWDGNLTLDGERVPAPAGTYAWRFTFRYFVSGGARGDMQQMHLDLPFEHA